MDSVSKGSNQSDESGGGIMDKGLLRPDPEVSEKKKNRYCANLCAKKRQQWEAGGWSW